METSTEGGHLRKIDNALPAAYTRKLYGNLPRAERSTGHKWLSTYAKAFGFHYNG
jgi:hypothetical protein